MVPSSRPVSALASTERQRPFEGDSRLWAHDHGSLVDRGCSEATLTGPNPFRRTRARTICTISCTALMSPAVVHPGVRSQVTEADTGISGLFLRALATMLCAVPRLV